MGRWTVFTIENWLLSTFSFQNRLWRKNRSRRAENNNKDGCVGVDLNANWNFQWGGRMHSILIPRRIKLASQVFARLVVLLFFNWCTVVGSSDDPCDDDYKGARPETEESVIAVRDFILKTIRREVPRARMAAFFTLHSYGPVWLIPFGHTYADPPNYKRLVRDCSRFEVSEESYLIYSGRHLCSLLHIQLTLFYREL